jgi:hypothetical protein
MHRAEQREKRQTSSGNGNDYRYIENQSVNRSHFPCIFNQQGIGKTQNDRYGHLDSYISERVQQRAVESRIPEKLAVIHQTYECFFAGQKVPLVETDIDGIKKWVYKKYGKKSYYREKIQIWNCFRPYHHETPNMPAGHQHVSPRYNAIQMPDGSK